MLGTLPSNLQTLTPSFIFFTSFWNFPEKQKNLPQSITPYSRHSYRPSCSKNLLFSLQASHGTRCQAHTPHQPSNTIMPSIDPKANMRRWEPATARTPSSRCYFTSFFKKKTHHTHFSASIHAPVQRSLRASYLNLGGPS